MAKVSQTLKALNEIRNDMGALSNRLDSLEASLTGELRAVGAVMAQVRDLLADRLDQRDRIEDHELRLRKLEESA